jgi:hypothetical protein
MIENWKQNCITHNCNYLEIEYPEFSQPNGYQLAINAKPFFIKKALELCNGRSVLYIDGDMIINKYPNIFDMKDVDIMCRGWWIDPRASSRFQESIMYDPYVFETSGGTIFFSNSYESNSLLNTWIKETSNFRQSGKADDRILSLIFNTGKYLLSMKIIQLPIEYLWLTLDYDSRLLEFFDYQKIKNMYFIEHPECLTTEETATNSGASSDRSPKFYTFLDSITFIPVSEIIHEYIMFPNIEMTQSFKSYFEYMQDTHYIDDGENEILIKKGFIHSQETREENDQPLYIVSYEDRLGKKIKYPYDEDDDDNKTYEIVSKINFNEASKINEKEEYLNIIKQFTITDDNYVEIYNSIIFQMENQNNERIIIFIILYYLQQGNNVIFIPDNLENYEPNFYNYLKSKLNTRYRNLEFSYVPEKNVFNNDLDYGTFQGFFKQGIMLNQPILFRPTEILIKFISMFEKLEHLSYYLKYGSYEFVSRIRVGLIIIPKNIINSTNSISSYEEIKTGGKQQCSGNN